MKKLVVILLVLITVGLARAQEFKVAKNSGRLELHLGNATIEGYDGKEIVFAL